MTSGSGLESGSGTNVWSKHELFVLSSSLSSEIEIEIEADCAPQRITSLSKVPQVISTTKTLRRCCGFILALLGFSFYSLRGLYLIVSFIKTMRSNNYDGANYPLIFGFGAAECAVAIFQFWIIIRYPRLTLKELNIKNVWPLVLIPIFSLGQAVCYSSMSVLISSVGFVFLFLFYCGYIYGLSLNGRSSSFWAGFKPYRYEMVPLILSISPASRAFPQYTIPVLNPAGNKM